MLDVGKLATLRAVVAHGSFSAAATAVGLTQPAVSRQVSMLERRVGTQLVRRTQQGVHPTEAGRLLVAHTDAVLDRLKLAEAQLADLVGLRAGHVRLGSFFTALIFLSAELAFLLETRHPALFRDQRQVIELAYFGGFSHSQIAEMLKLPAGTVKGRMRLGLTKLRLSLGDPSGALQ